MASPTHYFSRVGQCEFLEIDDDLDMSSLQTRLIESPTREILLSDRRSWTPSSSRADIDANTFLSDLGRLVSSVAKDFIPKSHVRGSFPFRLINDVDFRGQEDGYIAISYCNRANRDTPRRVVTPLGDLPFGWMKEVEQFPLPTRGSIFQAVLQERRIGEGLWFDQVCIEANEAERATTAGAIDTVYANARVVVIALDDVVATAEETQCLRYYVEQYNCSNLPFDQQPHMGMNPPFMHQFVPLRSFFERILSSTWFERAWCAHEMRMGQEHIFLLPCYQYYEDEAETVIRFTGAFFLHMLVLSSELNTFMPATQTKIKSLSDFFHRRVTRNGEHTFAVQRPDTPQSSTPQPASFVPMIAEVFGMKTGGDPRLPEYLRRLDANRDKTCIALNASGLPLALAPANIFQRPNLEDECLRSLLLVALAARDPVALCTTGKSLQLHDGSVSWLCRPSTLDVNPNRPLPSRFSRNTGQITQASDGRAEYAQLDLIFLDIPHRAQPNPHFPSHVARARVFIDLCVQYQVQSSAMWNFWQAPNHPRALAMQNIYIQALACVFECGPQWLLEVSSTLQQPHTPRFEPHTTEILLNPQLIIQNYILLTEGQAALRLLLNFVSTLIASGIPWASGASERTHGPLIISAPSYSETFDSSFAQMYAGKALVFAPFAHSKTLLIAVPDAVKGAEYDGLARGWILTSMNPFTGSPKPTVSWTLQSKGAVFGDGNFNVALARAGEQDVRNHRVYGP
ncbi:hypothetical protein P153DRAFT_356334 [Dothidotthia symphoricarpi CBS 119687]|uniref:Heterokaryon incompatibility domain-containing protein n=1 Tax=Dothidotthia symphoricarpi CBS 119687 TaxID=1392245 RepID=A0A6A6AF56_9PLEO|nr:uncharacterized protein P153DRAFT_356334 [Dothidotthia symphoricarpi CBS 119687]KAF2130602.1 hypothetical protein P153DRAFT_356334 [Dothidotthia symphoricarpi CBS 119687]